MTANFWTPDTAARFSEATPDWVRQFIRRHNEQCRYPTHIVTTELIANIYYAINWWHSNMGLLDKIVLRLLPKLSPFLRGKK